MPAAPLRERRVSSRSRAKGPGDRARPRPARPIHEPTSKLKAARKVAITPPAAGLAAGLLAVLILAAALATGGRAQLARRAADQVAVGASRLFDAASAAVGGGLADLDLKVSAVRLQGASRVSRDEILRAAAIKTGEPLFGLDLDAIRARVERVGWVQNARIIRLLPDTLVIAVTERPLMAIWQHGGRRVVVATNGQVAGGVDPNDFRALPLIVGDGANDQAAALLPAVLSRPRLAARLWAIRRVDQRRWDLVLKGGGVILLGASDETACLARLDRLDRATRALDLDLARIDLRDPDFTVVRPGEAPAMVSHGV